MKLDMNALMKQAQQMQEQMARAQEEAKNEIGEASAGGGMVTVKANGAGELLEIADVDVSVRPQCRLGRVTSHGAGPFGRECHASGAAGG